MTVSPNQIIIIIIIITGYLRDFVNQILVSEDFDVYSKKFIISLEML